MKRILIFYSHFSPAFKAGGPVQSLTNLVEALKGTYQIFVVCSAFEMNEAKVLDGIEADKWNDYNSGTRVFYATRINYKIVRDLFVKTEPDVVYINGIFLPLYNWVPLYFAKRRNVRIVIAPRGMLQKGALAVKPFKKKIFLYLFKFLGMHKENSWHATDDQELLDIRDKFGRNTDVRIALNIPKVPLPSIPARDKSDGVLKLIYLSLITEKKNLHLVLEALRKVEKKVKFHIYGPVKDVNYWHQCQRLMKDQIHDIQYKGSVSPLEVQATMLKYHAFILPTKGENFGHAIYEALSAGTVPIISSYTPWGDLTAKGAGFTVNSWEEKDWTKAITSAIGLDQDEFNRLSYNSFLLAKGYFEGHDFKSDYINLFG